MSSLSLQAAQAHTRMRTAFDEAMKSHGRALEAVIVAEDLCRQTASVVREVRKQAEQSREMRRDRQLAGSGKSKDEAVPSLLTLPAVEVLNVILSMTGAIDLADEGRLVDGLSLLTAGLRRAEALKNAGEPWAEGLIQRYQMTLETYIGSYGVRME